MRNAINERRLVHEFLYVERIPYIRIPDESYTLFYVIVKITTQRLLKVDRG